MTKRWIQDPKDPHNPIVFDSERHKRYEAEEARIEAEYAPKREAIERKLREEQRDQRDRKIDFNFTVLTTMFDKASPEWTDENSADGFFSNSAEFESLFGSAIDLLGQPDTEYRDRTDYEKRNLCNRAGCVRTASGFILGGGFCDICAERGYFGLGNKDLPIWERLRL